MAVDQALLQQLVDEIPFTKQEDKTYFLSSLKADEAAATQFVGQRLRHADYTKKTTELTTKEKDLATKANESVRTYATQLADAQTKLRDVMTQLETEQISTTKARALLAKVKTVYNLSDEDIPKIEDGEIVRKPGGAGLLDQAAIDQKFKDFETSLLTKLAPINQFPLIGVAVSEMQYEHQLLTGQRLPESKVREYMAKSAQDNGPGLKQQWEQEFGIEGLRKTKEREAWDVENRKKWDDEQTAKRSEAALRGVRPGTQPTNLSPVMSKKFEQHVDSTNKDMVDGKTVQVEQARANGPKLSGAERAAARFIERREAGIPMGGEVVQK